MEDIENIQSRNSLLMIINMGFRDFRFLYTTISTVLSGFFSSQPVDSIHILHSVLFKVNTFYSVSKIVSSQNTDKLYDEDYSPIFSTYAANRWYNRKSS